MAFFLITLKILIVLIIILFSILLLILLVPFEYFMKGQIDRTIGGLIETKWLFGLIKVSIYKYEDNPEVKISICGLNVYIQKLIKEDDEKKEKKADKKEKSQKKSSLKRRLSKDLLLEIFKYFKDIINIVKPKYFKISGVYGFEDPSLTGMLLGIISIIKGAVPKARIDIEPDFEEEFISIEAEIYGDIKVSLVCYRTLKLIIKKEVRKFLFKKSKTVETF